MVYFGEIMIIAGNPEDRNHGSTQAFFVKLGQANNSESFDNRKQRSREQPRLLSGENTDRTGITQTLNLLQGGVGSSQRPILANENVRDSPTVESNLVQSRGD